MNDRHINSNNRKRHATSRGTRRLLALGAMLFTLAAPFASAAQDQAPSAPAPASAAAPAAQPAPAKPTIMLDGQLSDDPIDPATIPLAIRGLAYEDRLGEIIPLDLPFTDSRGERVQLGRYFGKTPKGDGSDRPVVMLLIYFRCPSQCPGMLARLQTRLNELQIAAGDRFNYVVVSFDPTDTVAKAAELRTAAIDSYTHKSVLQSAADPHRAWEFLTDASGNGLTLAKALGFPVRYQAAANEYAHGSDIFILSPEGKICRYLGFDPPAQTLRLSLVEASEGKIGTTLDRVLLWCFHFDPNSNSYVIGAWRFMQVMGFTSAFAVAGLLWWMYRIEKRRRERAAAALGTTTPQSHGLVSSIVGAGA